MKMLVHQRDDSGGAGLCFRVLRSANNNHRRRVEGGKGCQEVSAELTWPCRDVVTDLSKLFRRRIMSEKFRVGCYQKQWCGHVAPSGPDLILNLRRQPVELS